MKHLKIFLRWSLFSFLFLGGIVCFKILTGDVEKKNPGLTLMILVAGAVLLGLIFLLLETQYIPWRKKKLQDKLRVLFHTSQVSDSVATFHLGGYSLLVQIDFPLSLFEYGGGNTEHISFHIPRSQLDGRQLKPQFRYQPDRCNGIDTYRIFITNGRGLKSVKKKLERQVMPGMAE